MIRLEIKNGKQTIAAICNKCKCHIKDLTTDDIAIKRPGDARTIRDSKGNEVTRSKHEYNDCKCDHCKHD